MNEKALEKELKDKVYSHSTRSERISWKRKLAKLEKLRDELAPIEQKILEIIENEKYPVLEKIEDLRKVMVAECVHPPEYLVVDVDYSHAVCKFCQKSIRVQ